MHPTTTTSQLRATPSAELRPLALIMLSGLLLMGCSAKAPAGAPVPDTQALIDTPSDTPSDAAATHPDGHVDGESSDAALACPVSPNLAHDLEHLDLLLDLAARAGVATWRIAPMKADGIVSFEVAGLSNIAVVDGAQATRCGDLFHVRVAQGDKPATVQLQYTFERKDSMTGLMKAGSSVTWPTRCGNLFPCHSAPAEGFSYSLEVTGLPSGHVAVHPAQVDQQVPSYAVALAHGAYTYHVVGETKSGLELGVWLKPNQLDQDGKRDLPALADLPKAVSWLEETLGPYPFGAKMGAVAVPWGPLAYGGLEMHPIYHMSDLAIGDLAVHCHEAAHGWFGNGVRIACWEDLVLSEGVADYLMVRAMGAVKGDKLMQSMFAAMEKSVANKAGTAQDVVVWQSSCDEIDVEASGVGAKITYHKGALFLRAVAQEVGYDKVDAALAKFFAKYVGTAQRMSALLDVIEAHTGFDPKPLAKLWLQTKGDPLNP